MRTIIALLLTLVTSILSSQSLQNDFKIVDKNVLLIQSNSVDTLAHKLCKPYKSEIEKVRAIFKWITNNIEYDVIGYQNPIEIYSGLFRSTISTSDSLVYKDYNDRIVEKVLFERRAICDGYSRVFKTLCDKAKIQCEIISGYIRWYSDPIGVMTNREHAWNAVFVNNKWQLLDVTWASGYTNENVTKFIKKYNEFYFLTDPVKLFNDHYPNEPKWALFSNPPTRETFYNYPFFHEAFFNSRIISYKPTNGCLEITIVNKKIQIELETDDITKTLYVMEYPYVNDTINHSVIDDTLTDEELDKKYAPKYKIIGKKIFLDYELLNDKTTRLDIIYNNKLILSYRVRVFK